MIKSNLESEAKNLKDLILSGDSQNKKLRDSLFEANQLEYNRMCVLLSQRCTHEMIEDYIEFNGGMKKIVYCNNCGL